MVKVKVCGITNLADAEKALEFGADMLGFNFYPPSARSIAPQKAQEILTGLPRDLFSVALFVNESRERVREVLGGARSYRALQFHGEENPEYCRGWDLTVIKAFRLKEKASLERAADYSADYYLVDSWSAGYGGSGTSFPWEWLENVDAGKLILSGGLSVENIGAAIRRVRPFGVDVCSGVEARPGVKDHEKLKAFIAAAKSA